MQGPLSHGKPLKDFSGKCLAPRIGFTYIHTFIHSFIHSFILTFYFQLHWVFVATHRFSLVAASGDYSLLQGVAFSLWWLLLLRSMGSRHADFSSCSTWAQQLQHVGPRMHGLQQLQHVGFSSCGMRAQQLWHTGLGALRHVGSSWTRDRTRVPCIGRWILNHHTTRQVPGFTF